MWKYPRVVYDSEKHGAHYPTMWMSEIAYIENLLLTEGRKKGHLNIVEWGSGNSTVYFSKFLKNNGISFSWNAIENFYPWYDRVREILDTSSVANEVNLYLKSKTFEDRKDVQEASDMSEFVNFPSTMNTSFDVALVDARQRDKCLELAAQVLGKDGVAIMHDAERQQYHWAFKYYDQGGDFAVENTSPVPGGVQKLWVGRLGAN
jgi:predicted O-methyltransferase YrrM